MNIDTEQVIYEVRERPVLWDSSHTSYKDRDARVQSWMEIYETLYPDYNTLEDKRKKEIEKSVQQRWKTARDAYIRCKNLQKNNASGAGGSKKKIYVYFDVMTFLDKNHQTIESEDSFQADAISNSANDNSITAIAETPNTFSQEGILEPQVLFGTPSLESPSPEENGPNFGKKPKNMRKRKYCDSYNDEFEKEIMTLFKENAKLMKNDDLAFFMSLLPITEKFSVHQKLIFRSEVLKKAMEIGNMSNPYVTNRLDSEHSY